MKNADYTPEQSEAFWHDEDNPPDIFTIVCELFPFNIYPNEPLKEMP
jgi:hypothetical protein